MNQSFREEKQRRGSMVSRFYSMAVLWDADELGAGNEGADQGEEALTGVEGIMEPIAGSEGLIFQERCGPSVDATDAVEIV